MPRSGRTGRRKISRLGKARAPDRRTRHLRRSLKGMGITLNRKGKKTPRRFVKERSETAIKRYKGTIKGKKPLTEREKKIEAFEKRVETIDEEILTAQQELAQINADIKEFERRVLAGENMGLRMVRTNDVNWRRKNELSTKIFRKEREKDDVNFQLTNLRQGGSSY